MRKPKTLSTFALVLCAVFGTLGLTQPNERPSSNVPARVEVPPLPPPSLSTMKMGTVLRVTQGDLLTVKIDDKEMTVRVCGADAPSYDSPTGHNEMYGEESLTFVSNLLAGEKVYLDPHPDAEYDRSHLDRLFYVYRHPDGLFVNAELLRQGYARCSTEVAGRYAKQFADLEARAMVARKGLWGAKPKPKPADQQPTKTPLVPVPVPT